MKIEINSAKLTVEFIDQETGELFTREATLGDFKEVKKTTSTTRTRKLKDNGNPNPQLTLLEGKVQLNTAAVNLVGWEPETKIDIRFEKKGRKMTPIMLEDPSKGNRLTKTYTISCRGSKHDNLQDFGTVFDVVPYEGKDGWFKLIGNAPEKEDDIVDIPEEIQDPDENLDLEETLDNISFDLDI